MATLIMTAKLNDVDPQAWLADVLPSTRHSIRPRMTEPLARSARMAGHPVQRLAELLPWRWRPPSSGAAQISCAA